MVLEVVVLLRGSVFLLIDPAKTWLDRAPVSLMRIQEKVRDIKEPVEQVKQATKEVEKLTQVRAGEKSESQGKETKKTSSRRRGDSNSHAPTRTRP
ncbi:MAG: hypothetical protein AB7E65_11735 [Syntrophotalea sp.]|uniref:hypothetical protein n=1 Tax=Syntrophotalea sp. TaxID=2812029 RepID=UPI003D09C0C5